ncbi:MAG: hypothetical protein AAFY91_12520 [Bacteroidota bacterium]
MSFENKTIMKCMSRHRICLEVDVVLGRPEKDCPGHGICKIEKRGAIEKSSSLCRQGKVIKGLIKVDELKQELLLVFNSHHATKLVINKHFRGRFFRLDLDYPFSNSIGSHIPSLFNAFIPGGKYLIKRRHKLVFVWFYFRRPELSIDHKSYELVEECRRGPKLNAFFEFDQLVSVKEVEAGQQEGATNSVPVYLSKEVPTRLSLHFDVRNFTRELIQRITPNGDIKIPLAVPIVWKSNYWSEEKKELILAAGRYPALSLPGQETVSVRLG